MFNILISKTDPYSFMGLIKARRMGGKFTSTPRGLINAGLASLFLIVAITRMAQAGVEGSHIDAKLTTTCRPEACKMV